MQFVLETRVMLFSTVTSSLCRGSRHRQRSRQQFMPVCPQESGQRCKNVKFMLWRREWRQWGGPVVLCQSSDTVGDFSSCLERRSWAVIGNSPRDIQEATVGYSRPSPYGKERKIPCGRLRLRWEDDGSQYDARAWIPYVRFMILTDGLELRRR